MKHYLLNMEERAWYGGYTDLFVVEYSDFTESTNDTEQTLELTSGFGGGDFVKPDVIADVITNFQGLTAATMKVGHGSGASRDKFLSFNAKIGLVGHVPDNTTVQQGIQESNELTVSLDPGVNGENLTQLTAGEVRIWASIFRAKWRKDALQL